MTDHATEVLALIPGRLTLPALLGFLLLFLRRHPNSIRRSWIVALAFILLSQAGWLASVLTHTGTVFLIGHVFNVDGQLLTAIALAASTPGETGTMPLRGSILWRFAANGLGPLLFSTCYGLYVTRPEPFYAAIVLSALILALTVPLRRHLAFVLPFLFTLAGCTALIAMRQMRGAAYLLLFAAFSFATVRFYRVLPRKTLGRAAILSSLVLWALSFAVHPFVIRIPRWFPFANNLWDLQPVFFCFGVLLLLVEEQFAGSQHLALHDQLTGLPNRRLLDGRLEDLLSAAREHNSSVALLLVDLNGFKAINDTYGHPVGDFVLVESTRRMRAELGPNDTLARLGGDEFVIITPLGAGPNLDTFEQNLQESLTAPFRINGREIRITGSFGCALYPADVRGLPNDRIGPALLHLADERMYVRKTAHHAAIRGQINALLHQARS